MPKAKPISLYSLSFDEAGKAFIRVDPTQANPKPNPLVMTTTKRKI
jgi:hypothetical protein